MDALPDSNEELNKLREENKILRQALEKPSLEIFRPRGWKQNSNAAYYQKAYAEIIRPYLEKLLTTNRNIFVERKQYHISSRSLLAMFNQSWLFLIDYSKTDEEKTKYIDLRKKIAICLDVDGIRLKWKKLVMIPKNEEIEVIPSEGESIGDWKKDIYDFIEKAQENQRLTLSGLSLRQEQVDWIRTLFESLQSEGFIITKLNSYSVDVIKSLKFSSKK